MKSILKNTVIILSIATCCTACSDILDKQPLDKFSEKDVWSNTEMVQAFLYPTLNSVAGQLIYDDRWTDNDVIQDEPGNSSINKEQIDRYYDAGWNIYGQIRKCNLALQKMEENKTFLESDRKYFIAQAKLLRGLTYYTRARLFGRLMLVDRVLNPDEDMKLPRTKTIKETYDFILKDIQEAIPDMPAHLDNQQGMLTKGAAYALLAEIALQGAAYIESGQDSYYQIAKEASESLFALNEYQLDNNYGSMFNDFDYAMNSKEIIFAQWNHETTTTFSGTWMQTMVPNVNNDKLKASATPALKDNFEGWPECFPSEDLVEDYEVIDADGKAKQWNQTSYYKNYQARGGWVSQAIFKNRDLRFYSTVVYDSTQYFNSIVTMRKNGNLHWDSRIGGDWGSALTGYLYRKGIYTSRRVYSSDPTYYHRIITRLGRAYLNYAEVMLRLNQPQKAIEYINKTRTQHGGLPALPLTLSLEDAWKAYKKERRVELVHEGDRYWSLLRWGKADNQKTISELNKVHHSISISADGKSFEIIPLPYRASENERIFTQKRYLFPVPQNEIQENPELDQNENW